MQNKMLAKKPFILVLYGYPGSGKSTFARQFAGDIQNTVHLQFDKIRSELKDANEATVNKLIDYMTQEFIAAGMSVVLDVPLYKRSHRKRALHLSRETGAKLIMVWLQIDLESAFARLKKRDRRTVNDKYSNPYTRGEFDSLVNASQNPDNEDYVVISGKHTYNTQRGAVFKKLEDAKVLSQTQTIHKKIKPQLVNLIPQSRGKDDLRHRNISIR